MCESGRRSGCSTRALTVGHVPLGSDRCGQAGCGRARRGRAGPTRATRRHPTVAGSAKEAPAAVYAARCCVGGWLPLLVQCGRLRACVRACVCVYSPVRASRRNRIRVWLFVVACLVMRPGHGQSRWGIPNLSMCTFALAHMNTTPCMSGEARWVSRVPASVAPLALIKNK